VPVPVMGAMGFDCRECGRALRGFMLGVDGPILCPCGAEYVLGVLDGERVAIQTHRGVRVSATVAVIERLVDGACYVLCLACGRASHDPADVAADPPACRWCEAGGSAGGK
jgi:hypothetical protein